MNDDDSGDEAEARHLLAKRREQAIPQFHSVRVEAGQIRSGAPYKQPDRPNA